MEEGDGWTEGVVIVFGRGYRGVSLVVVMVVVVVEMMEKHRLCSVVVVVQVGVVRHVEVCGDVVETEFTASMYLLGQVKVSWGLPGERNEL